MLFSVIIPTYNRSFELNRCLESLVVQNCNDIFEVIVIDDGSLDDSQAIIKGFTDRLNLKYLKIKNSGGPAYPRNLGIKLAIAEFILFLDSDDEFCENKIKRLASIVNPKNDIYYHDMYLAVDGKINKVVKSQKTTNIFNSLLKHGNFIFTSTVCIRRSILLSTDGFNISKKFVSVEDFEFWLRVSVNNLGSHYIEEPLIVYHHHVDGISKSWENALNILNVVRLYKMNIDNDLYLKFKIRSYNYICSILFHSKKKIEFNRIFKILWFKLLQYHLYQMALKLIIKWIIINLSKNK